jgi:hypothetical protein
MASPSDMRYTLYRRKRTRDTEEVSYGRSWVFLVTVVLLFVLILLGRMKMDLSALRFFKWL